MVRAPPCCGRRRRRTTAWVKLPPADADAWHRVEGRLRCVAEAAPLLVSEARLRRQEHDTAVLLQVKTRGEGALLADAVPLGDLLDNLDYIHFTLDDEPKEGRLWGSIRWAGRLEGGGSPSPHPLAADGRGDDAAAAAETATKTSPQGVESCVEAERPPPHSCGAEGREEASRAHSPRAEECVQAARPPLCSQAAGGQDPDPVAQELVKVLEDMVLASMQSSLVQYEEPETLSR